MNFIMLYEEGKAHKFGHRIVTRGEVNNKYPDKDALHGAKVRRFSVIPKISVNFRSCPAFFTFGVKYILLLREFMRFLSHTFHSWAQPVKMWAGIWLRLWFFWLAFFAAFRLGFLLTQPYAWPSGDAGSPWQAFRYALPLDASMAGYLVLLPVFVYFISLLFKNQIFIYLKKIIDFYNKILIAVLIAVFGANIFLYPEWGTLLNARALQYMRSPEALLDSVSPLFMAGAVFLYALLVRGAFILYGRWVSAHWAIPVPKPYGLLAFPLHIAGIVLAIRGGTGVMAINESAVCYSTHPFNNHAATNTAWHLIHTLIERREAKSSYVFMEAAEARQRLNPLFSGDSTAVVQGTFTKTQGPLNVVIVALESMTAQVVEHLGGTPGLCPNLEALARTGIRFDSCYSSGFRTDQGLPAILSGYPAQPDQSIVFLTEKSERLPGLSRILKGKGYSTAFFYGGGLTFANIGLWLRSQGFERIVSESNFEKADITQRWGVDDERLLQRCCREITALPEPFFAAALTLSLHPPYDIPGQSAVVSFDNEADLFRRSAAFTDAAVGHFMAAARQQPWYDRTLFVFTADHGSLQPGRLGGDQPLAKHIPLLICGVPLADEQQGRVVRTLCNHHDLPATLLGLLGMYTPEMRAQFPWSRPLPAPSSGALPHPMPFAYYSNETGLGWMEGHSAGFYEFSSKKWHFYGDSLSESAQMRAKAYLQLLYKDFLSR